MEIPPHETPRESLRPPRPRGAYGAHAAFVAVARQNPSLWTFVLGVFIIEMFNGFLLGLLRKLLLFLSEDFAMSVFRGDSPAGLIVQLFAFALLALSVVVVVRQRYGRGQFALAFFTLTGPPMSAIRQFRVVLPAVVLLLVVIEILPPWWSLPELTETRAPVLWVALLPIALVALLVQTSAEEIFYRGFIQQQIAARFKLPLLWLVVPNILFALSHFDNGATEHESLQYVIWAFFFGLAASDLTGRTGTIGAAVAFHLVNNAYAFLFFGEQGGPDSGLALYLLPAAHYGSAFSTGAGGPLLNMALITEILVVGLMWLAARVALRR